MTRIAATIAPDRNPADVFENLKRVGVTDATLEGYVVFGAVVNSLIGPLRSVDGVIEVIGEKEHRAGESAIQKQPVPPVPSPTPIPIIKKY